MGQSSKTGKSTARTTDDTRARVREIVREVGATAASRLLSMQRETVLAIAADAHCHAGSIALARERCDALDDPGTEPTTREDGSP
jgi:hypothetical protein